MDKLVRIIIMLFVGGCIPFLANIIYEPFRDLDNIKKLNIVEKVLWGGFYIFILNWLIIVPSMIFFECFKYLINN